MGMDTCRLRTTGQPSDFAAIPASQLSTELWVWTILAPCTRMRHRNRMMARTSVALAIRTASTGMEAACASARRGLSGWQTINVRQP